MGDNRETLAGDLMIGADKLALFLFGKDDDETRRRIYGMSPAEQKALGIFKWGKQYAARKTTLLQNIAKQEAGSFAALAEPERAVTAGANERAETKRRKAAKLGQGGKS
jgi:hypothetical protein